MSQSDEKYHDREWLFDRYWRDELTPAEIAEQVDCSMSTIHHWLNKHGIPKRQSVPWLWTVESELRRLYWDEDLSLDQIADRLNTTRNKIDYWLRKHGIERRTAYNQYQKVPFKVDNDGYPVWRTYHDGDYHRVAVHRLLAVAEYGYDAVVNNDVHHENGVRWDNRPKNIGILDPSEHRRLHGEERADEQRELMRNLRQRGKLSGES